MLKCLIADDEQLARQLLASYVAKLPQLELVGQCRNAMETMQQLQENHIDLLFLDIQMPDLTGIQLLRTLARKPAVVFTTAYPEYALEGYELDVADYLLKPFSFERFVQAVNKVQSQVANAMPQPHTAAPGSEYITLKADHRIYKVKIADIAYIEGLREYVTFFLPERKIITLESLKKLEAGLPEHFLRVHKSYIVNIHKISSLYGNQLEIGKKQIPIGKTYKAEVLRVFGQQ